MAKEKNNSKKERYVDTAKMNLKKEINKKIGEVLGQLRSDKELTLEKLASDLSEKFNTIYPNAGVDFALDYRTLFNYEHGTEVPYYIIILYAHYFGVSTDYILGIETPKKENMKNDVLQILENSMKMIKEL